MTPQSDGGEMAWMIAAGLMAPFLLIAISPFLKIAIVLGALRYGLGAKHILSGPVVAGIALVFSLHAVWPLVAEIRARSGEGASAAAVATQAAPVAARFLEANSLAADTEMFRTMSSRRDGDSPTVGEDISLWTVHAPAFVVSELTRAFQIALLVALPLLVIDLVVASVCLTLGTHLSPTLISLPLKVLVFVLSDAWRLLAEGLLAGYRLGG
jgi:flagellar biosynthesis protein FliP